MAAAASTAVSELGSKLSSKAKILTDSTEEEFKVALERWTDIDKKTPGAIVFVAVEEDVLVTVQTCLKHKIKFVAKAGGHSAWSTIGADGIIIDLSLFNAVTVNKAAQTFTIQGGANGRQVISTLAEAELCVPTGTGNTVGIVPQALGGGLSAMSCICGSVSDNILSARLITAAGELITVNDKSHADLMWGLRGAGQHFALVTELTIQAYPISILGGTGPDHGSLWTANVIFPPSRIGELIQALGPIASQHNIPAAGLGVITTDPGSGSTVVMCVLFYLGTTAAAQSHFQSIKDLGPLVFADQRVPYSHINDAIDPFCVKGGFKHFQLAGIPAFESDPDIWTEVVRLYEDLVQKAPDARGTGWGFEFVGGEHVNGKTFPESAWSHQGVGSWIESLSWHTDPASTEVVNRIENEMIALATRKYKPEQVERYQNFTREGPLAARFGSAERVERLKKLKREWDPEGVYTRVFLE